MKWAEISDFKIFVMASVDRVPIWVTIINVKKDRYGKGELA